MGLFNSNLGARQVASRMAAGNAFAANVWGLLNTLYTNLSGVTATATEINTVADGITATAAEINHLADISNRLVAAGASLSVTQADHDSRTILLNQAAGSTITLPAATGSGTRFRFVSSVKPTSNQHRINVTGDDEFAGSIIMLDLDSTPESGFGALSGGDNDQINMNGGTTGGQVGDLVDLLDIASGTWQVLGQLMVPSGSNPATPFATGQNSS